MPSPTDVVLGQILATVNNILSIDSQILFAQTQGETLALLRAMNTRLDGISTQLDGAALLLTSMSATLTGISIHLDELDRNASTSSNTTIESLLRIASQLSLQIGNVSLQIGQLAGGGGATASDVWGYIQPGEARPQGYWQVQAGKLANNIGDAQPMWLSKASPLVGITAYWNQSIAQIDGDDPPHPNINALGPYSTVLAWLNATSGRTDWTLGPGGYYQCEADLSTDGTAFWVCQIRQADFDRLKATTPTSTLLVPPIWPGVDLATLGTEVALTDQMELAGPMHGVIIRVNDAPSERSHYAYGSHTAVAHIGAITFENDAGAVERFEAFNFDKHILSPRLMTVASKVFARVYNGVSATIQPWSITA